MTDSSNPNELKTDPTNFITEIRRMMYGFGDCAEPLLESAKIINSVVYREMKNIIYEACKVAEMRDSSTIEDKDVLFLLRRDKIQLQRLIKYLDLKEFKSSINKVLEAESVDGCLSTEDTKKKSSHRKFIESIDNIGDLIDSDDTVDLVKRNRELRAELASRKLNTQQYFEYSKARSASFANKFSPKFTNWLTGDDNIKISKPVYTILSYLAYETVAQIVDLALLVRQDQNKIFGDTLDRLKLNYCNPVTYKPYQHGRSPAINPITPAEINEALRRFWSPQLDQVGPFQRRSLNRQDRKFLSFQTG
ncbi:transcription initiation protein SPT3 homolog isoform X1 [Microplitis demolitor]|uniref:transcription initiation protein SPT3 homolog isoform X1 n=1 Tax=Microplitis demolitor TaxID=69319 RepID=UPI0004CDA93B|nr:transcription initiation protein SPT3 homolog isoform X1 [Microplitis demolitor]